VDVPCSGETAFIYVCRLIESAEKFGERLSFGFRPVLSQLLDHLVADSKDVNTDSATPFGQSDETGTGVHRVGSSTHEAIGLETSDDLAHISGSSDIRWG